jgi:DNA-binding CsgD family transcriptional regulator
LSGDGRALFVNRAASTIAAHADGMRIDASGLHAAQSSQSSALRKLIARTADGGADAAGGMLALSRPSGRRPLTVLIAPLPASAVWLSNRRPGAIAFVIDPERAQAVPEEYLQRLYGLTPAEAAVAVQILRGDGLKGVVDSLRISLPTARTHLQRVFEKTGTRRQTQLIRLIAESQGIEFDRSHLAALASP